MIIICIFACQKPLFKASNPHSKLMDSISHSGIVESIDGNQVNVRIRQTSACAACKVASYCNAAESKEKIISVTTTDSGSYVVGQEAVVATSGKTAAKALLWAFGVPCMLLIAVLTAGIHFFGSEGTAALAAMAATLGYYFLLWTMRDKIAAQVTFVISPASSQSKEAEGLDGAATNNREETLTNN